MLHNFKPKMKMKETTYFVRLEGGYYYKLKARNIMFNIDGNNYSIKTSQVVFWNESANQKGTEFLIEISEDELKKLKSFSKVDFDIRKRYGTGSLPPRPGVPPPIIEFLRWS